MTNGFEYMLHSSMANVAPFFSSLHGADRVVFSITGRSERGESPDGVGHAMRVGRFWTTLGEEGWKVEF